MDKLKIIIFEGSDKVGKSTIYQKFNKKTNYEYFCIDRFTGSGFVYNTVFKRLNINKEIIDLESELTHLKKAEIILVYLFCNKKIQKQRILKQDKKSLETIKNLSESNKKYKKYLKKTPFKKILIDTSKITTNQVVNTLIQKIKEL